MLVTLNTPPSCYGNKKNWKELETYQLKNRLFHISVSSLNQLEKMIKLIALLLLSWSTASGEKYYVELDHFLYPGVPGLPEYGVTYIVQGLLTCYFNEKVQSFTHDWLTDIIKEDKQQWDMFVQECLDYEIVFRAETSSFNKHSNESQGNEIFQQIIGCDWDNETDQFDGYVTYGDNGDDFMTFDFKRGTWFARSPNAEAVTKTWNEKESNSIYWRDVIQEKCVAMLKMFVRYGKTYLERKVLPSVSLLQRTLSSPVTCHSTGFFPDQAIMFWRKDGEEIHEGVEHGNILPNVDGSFQISVDLDVSSIPLEDWGRYDCMVKLSGVPNYVVTKLDQDLIRSNNRKTGIKNDGPLTITSIAIIATVTCVIIIIIVPLSFKAFKKRNEAYSTERCSTPSSDTSSDTASDTASL